MKKISVIMGVYRPEPTMLNCAVASILKQSFADLELLICDDGSEGDTWQILKRLAESDKRIRLLRHTRNQGLAAALNTCIAQAKGDFIARQDADDISHPNRLQEQMDYLNKHPDFAFVGCNLNYYDDGGVWGVKQYPPYPKKRDFLFSIPFTHGTMVFRRKALESVGGYQSGKHTRLAEDYELLMRMYARGLYGGNLQQSLYDYREDESSRAKRDYLFRINDVFVRAEGFARLGLLPKGLPYVFKPLVVGLLPKALLFRLKKRYYNIDSKQAGD